MKLKIAGVVVLLLLVIAGLMAYLFATAGRELSRARAALSGSPLYLREARFVSGRTHLRRALEHLDSLPLRILGMVPIGRQNVTAMRSVAEGAIPVVRSGLELDRRLAVIEQERLMGAGRVQLDLVTALRQPVQDGAQALAGLERRLREHRNGWLMPALWEALDVQLERVRSLRAGAERADAALGIAPDLLGERGRRRYLVLMLNNAELRGAGGILSGIGTIEIVDGRLRLGDFSYYRELADDPPFRSVKAPADYRRHFRAYDAATTRWVAASSSPDVPDVAVVGARLYRLVRGSSVDGALVVDARGLAALMPPQARIVVRPTGTRLGPEKLPNYLYARAYRQLDAQVARRDALIDVGQAALSTILQRGLGGRKGWAAAADAAAGGHLRFVSFSQSEQRTLERLGITGELGTPRTDGLLVTVQNYGGNKLDFYARRTVRHACDLGEGGEAECATEVRISNQVPRGLSQFVVQYRPYGLFKNFIEIYVPRGAELTGVTVDGRAARFATAREDGYTAVGVYEEIPRGQASEVTVGYRLATGDAYSLVALPQPLTHDAQLEVALEFPSGWRPEGPGRVAEGTLRWSGPFDRALSWRLAPQERAGLAALWPRLQRFWREPVF